MQFVGFLMASYHRLSSHPLAALLEPEPLFPNNSVSMVWELHGVTTPRLGDIRSALRGHIQLTLEIHSEARMKFTERMWLSEFRDAVGTHDQLRFQEFFEGIDQQLGKVILLGVIYDRPYILQ